ncbi:hypothetical protein BOX15_Mlig019133g1, partial [Macrostomum lignano]
DNNDSLVELFASYNDDAESECADGWHDDSRSDEGVPVEDENAIAEPTAVQFACGQSWPSQLPMSMAPVTQYCQPESQLRNDSMEEPADLLCTSGLSFGCLTPVRPGASPGPNDCEDVAESAATAAAFPDFVTQTAVVGSCDQHDVEDCGGGIGGFDIDDLSSDDSGDNAGFLSPPPPPPPLPPTKISPAPALLQIPSPIFAASRSAAAATAYQRNPSPVFRRSRWRQRRTAQQEGEKKKGEDGPPPTPTSKKRTASGSLQLVLTGSAKRYRPRASLAC